MPTCRASEDREVALPMHVAVIGVGLIGGSLGMALRRLGVHVAGYDLNAAAAHHALEHGVVDVMHDTPVAAVGAAELVVLCVPPDACAPLLSTLAPALQPGVVICDTGSVKRRVVTEARRALGPAVAGFVPAHPIAGREFSGVGAAVADLYHGCRVILTPAADTDTSAIRAVERLWRAVGADSVQSMEAQRHDELLAACSHLPHLVAFALVDHLAGHAHAEDLFRCAAGGFADFTRIAASDPLLWRQISLANRDVLGAELRRYAQRLTELGALLQEGDAQALEVMLERAATARRNYVDPRPDSS